MTKVDLSKFKNPEFHTGSLLKRILWYYTNLCFFRSGVFPVYGLKRGLLRCFGAKVGKGVVIKPHVNIKYPWNLSIGAYSWIGEGVWIDNLAQVTIKENVCLSQNAFLLTGNHNYKKQAFNLMIKPIVLEEGVWIGAKAIVCPGVTAQSHAMLSVGSVATKDLEPFSIYTGNPAVIIKKRVMED